MIWHPEDKIMGTDSDLARWVLRLVLIAVVCLTGIACSRDDAAERIRQRVAEGAELAERHDLGGLLAMTVEEFRAEPGNRDRQGVREMLAAALYYYNGFHLLYPRPVVKLAEDGFSATVEVPFLIVRRQRSYPGLEELYDDPGGWLERVGENADLYHLELELEKRGEAWQAVTARLGSFGGLQPSQ